jgi:MFS family permease
MKAREIAWVFGTSLSLFGSNALYIAFVVWIQQLTGSSSLAGMAIFAFLAPSVLAPVSGLIADRVRRARLLIAVDLVMAVWVCLALLVHRADQVWLIFVVLVGLSVGQGLEGPASGALLSTVVGRERLGRVNAVFRTCKDLSRTAGPALGVLISRQLGIETLILIDAATFLVSAVCIWQLRAREERPQHSGRKVLPELAAGIRHVAAVPLLRRLVTAISVSLLIFGMLDPALIHAIRHILHTDPGYLGVLESVASAGAICGGLLCVRIIDRVGSERLVRMGLFLLAGGAVPLLVPNMVTITAGCFVIGVGGPMGVVGYVTTALRHSPDEIQGRVMSVTDVAIMGPQALAAAVGTGLLTVLPYHALIAGMIVVVGLCAASLTPSRLAPPAATKQGGAQPEALPRSS